MIRIFDNLIEPVLKRVREQYKSKKIFLLVLTEIPDIFDFILTTKTNPFFMSFKD